MMWIRNIALFVLGSIFLLTSAGIVIFKTHCACTGNEKVSLYITPETCTTDYHEKHNHIFDIKQNLNHESDCCNNHHNDCGCSEPDVEYVKLKNQLIDEEIEFVKYSPHVQAIMFSSILVLYENEWIENETKSFYIDPPPTCATSTDYLIKIHKLKIPVSA